MSKSKHTRPYQRAISSKDVNFVPKTENQQKFVDSIENNIISFGIGFPGVGKSFVAAACALKMLINKQIEKIVIIKPTVSAGAVDLGFLPGSVDEKIGPFVETLLDLFDKLISAQDLERLYEEGQIEVRAVSFLRGTNWEKTFIIVDEAQNLESELFYMLLTRICGDDTKLVFCGDERQTDLKHYQKSGLQDAIGKVQHIEGIGVVEFTVDDCQRAPIVKEIIKAYCGDTKSSSVALEPVMDPRLPKKRTSRKKAKSE